MMSTHPSEIELAPARVVLAEDDAEFRSVVAAVLRKAGYEVIEAEDGERLVDLMADGFLMEEGPGSYDLVISDVRMPGWTGLEVLRSLRTAGDRTPMLLITAFGDDRVHEEARRLGAVATLDKPFDLATLRAATLNALKARAA